jgi:hypothetical protein
MDQEQVVVLTHEQLEPMKCGMPGCEACDHVLTFGNACHPFAPLAAFYVKAAKVLHLACAECGSTVAGIAVAECHVPRTLN